MGTGIGAGLPRGGVLEGLRKWQQSLNRYPEVAHCLDGLLEGSDQDTREEICTWLDECHAARLRASRGALVGSICEDAQKKLQQLLVGGPIKSAHF